MPGDVHSFAIRLLTCLALLLVGGCTGNSPNAVEPVTPPAGETKPVPSIPTHPVRLLIVDDAGLAPSLERNWAARSEQPLEVQHIQLADWRSLVQSPNSSCPDADAILFPSEDTGELAARNWLLPLPAFAREDSFAAGEFAESDIFMSLRRGIMAWGDSMLVIPLSSGQLFLAVRTPAQANERESSGAGIPDEGPSAAIETWGDLQDFLRTRAGRVGGTGSTNPVTKISSPVFAQPLGEGWGARMLLIRAAAYVKEPGRYADLFELGSVRSLIAEPPFVRALNELLADQAWAPPAAIAWTPQDVMEHLERGDISIGIGANSRTRVAGDTANSERDWTYFPLPGSREVYRFAEQRWETLNAARPVPLMGVLGRVGGVVRGTRRQRAAWNVLVRISGKSWGADVCSEGQGATPFRISQMEHVNTWLKEGLDDRVVSDFRGSIRRLMDQPAFLLVPRIPRAERYLSALEEAVRNALAGKQTAEEALRDAAVSWDAITTETGRDNQSRSLLRHYGL